MKLNIFVSSKCFVYCKGCYSYSREENNCAGIETDNIVKFLEYAFIKGISEVTFCGGDPLLRKDIIELLRQTKNIGYKISVDTLGTTIVRDVKLKNMIFKKLDIKNLVKYVDEIGIPIDGSSSNIIKTFRQCDYNILNEQLDILREINKYKGNITVNTVVHKENLNDCLGLVDIINNIGFINKWQIFQYIPAGKYGLLNRKKYEISEEQFNLFKQNVLKNINTKISVETKNIKSRNLHNMLIDNSGNAWIQNYNEEFLNARDIIGNICELNDFDKIINYIKQDL